MVTINDMIKEGRVLEDKNAFMSNINDTEAQDVIKKYLKQDKKKGLKYNKDKLMLAQFYKHFPNAYKAMVDNAMYGFKKYNEDINDPNWKKNEIWEYEDALFRHFSEYLTGNLIDEESGKKHLAAVIWNAMALYELNEIKEKNNE